MMKMSKIVNSKYSAWCTLYNAWPQNKHRYRTSQVKMYGLFLLHLEIIGDFLCSWVRSPPWFVLVHLFLPITGTSSKFLRFPLQLRNQGLGITVQSGLGICSFAHSFLLFCSNSRLWANCSCRSIQKSDRELFAPIALYKSDWLLSKRKSLFCSFANKKRAIRSKNQRANSQPWLQYTVV